MKRVLFLLLCVLPVSCAGKNSYVGYYISFDDVEVRESPSDDAPVVMKLSCGKRPSKYDKKTAEIPYAFMSTDSNEKPVGVRNVDESGKWGYFEERIPFIRDWKGWIPLDKMICVGTVDETVKLPAFEVKGEDWVQLYKHPKEDEKEKTRHRIRRGEIVQQYATAKNWTFIHAIVHSTVGVPSHLYGWAKNSNLSKVEDSSEEEIEKNGYKLLEERVEKEKGSLKFRRTMYYLFRHCCYLALVFAILFLIPAFIHRRATSALFVFPTVALLLLFFGELAVGKTLIYGLLMPLVWYTLLYPLLYTPASRVFPPAYCTLSIASALLVMGINEFAKGGGALGHILLVILYVVPVVFFSFFLSRLIYNDTCPHCGYYGGHALLETINDGTTTSESTGVEDIYTGTTTETRGNTQVTTEHYKRVPYTLITTTSHYRDVRKCRHCEEIFYNYRSSSHSRKA